MRLHDNPALHAALAHGAVIPLFILDPAILNTRWHRAAIRRREFLLAGLRSLDRALRSVGSRLLVRSGEPVIVLGSLVAESGATAIYAVEDFSPYARRRDAAVQTVLPLTLTDGVTVHHPAWIQRKQGGPYTVFTPFYRAWRAWPMPRDEEILDPPRRLASVPSALSSEPLPPTATMNRFEASETEAHRRLAAFVTDSIYEYGVARDVLAREGTSTLSPYLRFGLLSPRNAVVTALRALGAATDEVARQSAETWLKELVWREFYVQVMYHFPQVLRQAFNPRLREIAWRDDPVHLAAWRYGKTGFPIVDACMRQLLTTGWMHNRGRMIAASFLVKDLLIDWREGEAWFMQHLIDGDPAANNGGWQWTAGVGTDAAPYFRIFNPVTQGQKFDPEGTFIRRYVPELAKLPTEHIHTPWRMTALEQTMQGVQIGDTYPAPIVDRAQLKERTLAAYRGKRDG